MKKRKGLSLILILMMVFAMGLCVQAADGKIYLRAEKTGATTVQVSCEADGVAETTDGKLLIYYNTEKLQYTGYTDGSALDGYSVVVNDPIFGNLEEGELILVFASANASTLDGSMLNMTFEILDGASVTEDDFSIVLDGLKKVGDNYRASDVPVEISDTVYADVYVPESDSEQTDASSGSSSGSNAGNTASASSAGSSNAIESKQPTLKVTVAGAKKLKLSWSAVSGAEKYEISYATKANGTYKKKTVSGTSYTLTGLTKNQTYYLKVRAVATSGGKTYYSKDSSVVSAKAYGKPSKPTLKVKKSGNKLKLSWKKQSNIKKYEIYCKVGKGKYQKIKTVKGKKTSCKISTKKYASGQKLSFRIRAYYQVDGVKIYSAKSKVVKITL